MSTPGGSLQFARPTAVPRGLRSARQLARIRSGDVAHHVTEHGAQFSAGELLDAGGIVVGLVEVAQPRHRLAVARDLSARPVKALQVVLADPSGHLPGEPGFAEHFSQPVLGNPAWLLPEWRRPQPARLFGGEGGPN